MNLTALAPRLLLTFGATAVALLGLELGFRIWCFGAAGLSFCRVNSVNAIGQSGLIRPSPHADVIFELRPDLDTHFKLQPFRTNSTGLRDREYRLEKPAGTFRVAVVGDSFTMASAARIEDAYHSVIEEELNAQTSRTRYEFINFGTGGYTIRQYVGVLRGRVQAYRPDVVLVGITANDDVVHPEERYQETYRVKPRGEPFFDSFLYQWLDRRLSERQRPDRSTPDAQAYLDRSIGAFARWSDHYDTPVVLAFLTYASDKGADVGGLAAKHGLSYVDTTPAFAGEDRQELGAHCLDRHPNARAHRIYANAILTHLRDQGLLPIDR